MDFGNRKTAGVLQFVGGTQFAIALIIAEEVYPNYSVSENYISDLGVWGKPSAFVFNSSLILFGLAVVVSSYFIQREFRMRSVSILFALAGAGSLGVGIFPENVLLVHGVPIPHTIAAVTSFVIGGVSAIASYKITKSPFRYLSVIFGVASLVALSLFISTATMDYLGLGVGGMERMIVYPTLLWTIGLGGNLMTSPAREKG